jgi:quercetin dioxygenase-like cupin family protein
MLLRKINMADGYFVTPAEAPQLEMSDRVHRRTMGTTDEAMLCEIFLEKGAVIERHQHQNDQVGYVVYGEVTITIGDETRVCSGGDSYAIPGGVIHQVEALKESLLVDVFSPPRKDFLTDAR